MRALILLITCITVASAGIIPSQKNNTLDEEWKTYKAKFNKTYPTKNEETMRRLLWEKNLRRIQKHNLEADMGKHSYLLGMNHFGDLSYEEYLQMFKTIEMNETQLPIETFSRGNLTIPGTFDWRTRGVVTPVKKQNGCHACWAFSVTGVLEGQHCRKVLKLVSLSEQNLIDCSGYGNNGCKSGSMASAMRYIIENGGIDTEEGYPYEAKDGPCRFNKSTIGATMKEMKTTRRGDEEQLKLAVLHLGPIAVSVDASGPFLYYTGKVYDNPKCKTDASITHSMLIVGYGDFNGKDYWLVKNSWGRDWGLDGYIMMSRNKKNQCGIASRTRYPVV